ncbi:MAG TPA: LacI family DNA-binding transcriptional regulator [Actinomycetota bacterium]
MARQKAVGIKDVAREAGVSITTVSHALSGKGRLPEETRLRVRRVAAELGYTPNAAARSLAGGRTGLLATYVSLPGNAPLAFTEIEYYVDVINAATAAAIERGYALVVAPTTAGDETWSRLPLDGAVVIDPAEGDPSLAALRERHLALVLIGRDLHGSPDDVVVQNDRAAGTRTVLDHLARRGARRVGVLTFETYESFSEDAVDEYRAWCSRRRQVPVVLAATADPTAGAEAFRRGARVVFDLPETERPDAVFCLYEGLGAEVLALAADRGVSVPGDLMVAAIAEMGLAETTIPTLTTLELDQAALGATAAELLMDLVEGEPASSVRDLPTRLVPRDSTAR